MGVHVPLFVEEVWGRVPAVVLLHSGANCLRMWSVQLVASIQKTARRIRTGFAFGRIDASGALHAVGC